MAMTIALLLVFAAGCISLVHATPVYSYTAASDHHGVDVGVGELIQVWATTDDPDVTKVTFTWNDGNGNPIYGPDTVLKADAVIENGNWVFYAPIHFPSSLGDWGVQVKFFAPDGHIQQQDIIAIKATSFNSINMVPEVPLLGTAGACIAMVLGFMFVVKHKRIGTTL
jgi:hypothetical protein